jgi:signal transduction histidine kinase
VTLGLRARLLLGFVLLSTVTAAAVAGGMYVRARTAILQRAQDAAVQQFAGRLESLFPLPAGAPTGPQLDGIAALVSDRDSAAVAEWQGTGTAPDTVAVPAGLRQAVHGGDIAWQRVVRDGRPVLLIGAPLLVVQPDGTTATSGIEVYAARGLTAEQRSIDELAATAWLTGGGAVLLAVLLALLAAHSVLRPARELDRAARRLGQGELRTRVAVRGSDELAGVARTFNETAAELERHVAQLRTMEADARRFVADVSHELRTPLAALTAVADVLDEEAARLPEPAGQAARLVSGATHDLSRLVADLLEISRFDAGVAALALDDVDLTALVRATLRSRGWTDRVEADLPAAVPARLDPRRVDLVVANLVGNALSHGAPPVRLRLRADADRVTVEVRDAGPGVPPAARSLVFDRFYKADAARGRSDGSGLGLAIARENARLHGGDITVGDDGGAVFTLWLPR